jgi:hypothetical protein
MQYTYDMRPDGRVGLGIDLGNIVIPELDGKELLLSFPIKTYKKMCKQYADDDEDSSFKAINNFFDWIDDNDKRIIIIYLAHMHHRIRETLGVDNINSVIELSQELGRMVLSLNNTISLYKKLVVFSDEQIPINLLKDAGSRPQDTPIMTYYYDDIVKLMACILLSKMMAPIFGTIMYYLSNCGIESRLKEIHCLPIVSQLYDAECPEVIFKLKRYIEPIVNKEFHEDISAVNIGLTKNSITNHVFVNLVVRNFINIDIYRENSNHITAIRVGIKKAISTQCSVIEQNRVMVRSDMSNTTDDQKRSQLEVDSIISEAPFDMPIIAEAFIDRVITKFIREYDIDRDVYNECYEHNLKTRVTYNVLNKLVLEMLFSAPLSGSSSLKFIRAKSMTKLITTAQLICITLGFYELSHSLTAQPAAIIKSSFSDTDQIIMVGYLNKPAYKAYLSKLMESSLGECLQQFFTTRVSEIMGSIVSDTHLFNIPQVLLHYYSQGDINNKSVQFSDSYITELCGFLNLIWPEN